MAENTASIKVEIDTTAFEAAVSDAEERLGRFFPEEAKAEIAENLETSDVAETPAAEEIAPSHAVKLLELTDTHARIGGWGVLFGGVDLTGESFVKDTDLALDLVPSKPVYYDHTRGDVENDVGRSIKEEIRERGVWVEAQLERSKAYADMILELIEDGALGFSSGSVSHLVRKERKDGRTLIKKWPIIEYSLTPEPAEPRTRGVAFIKSLAEKDETYKVFLPQDAGDASVDTGDSQSAGAETTNPPTNMKTEITMEENIQEQPRTDIDAIVREAANKAAIEAVAAFQEELAKRARTNDAGYATGDQIEVVKDAAEVPFKGLGHQLKAVQVAAVTGGQNVDPRLAFLNKAIKATGMSEGVPSDGGFLVQTDFATELMRRAYETGLITSRCDRKQASANANGATINYVDETSRATGSRWGGIQAYWLAEAGTKTASKPKFGQMNLKLNKLIGLAYATDELLADTSLLGSIITEGFAEEFGWLLDNAVFRGTGAGTPLGILIGGSLVTVSKETGQAAKTVVAENVLNMWSRMYARSRLNGAWYINQDIEPQLFSMDLPVGTGGTPVYMPPGGLSQSPYASLMGRPVIPVEQASTLGTIGDIVFADFSQYVLLEKGGIESATSIHVQFVTDETAFRFVLRVDGQPKWVSALTPANGTNTLSPFVALETRS
jgi:HK97 family phage major capsid protein